MSWWAKLLKKIKSKTGRRRRWRANLSYSLISPLLKSLISRFRRLCLFPNNIYFQISFLFRVSLFDFALSMASSITPSIHSSIRPSRLPSLYLLPSRISPNHVLLQARSRLATKSTRLAFSPLPEIPNSPVALEFSRKPLRIAGWSPTIRQRGSIELPVVKAAAADSEGSDLLCFFRMLPFGC